MKIYLTADIEGIAGITDWSEARKGDGSYPYFARQMTREVAAACEGANLAGAKEIYVKDAHGTGRNIDPLELPENVKLIRGWSGHPYMMLQDIDESFDAVGFVAYHAAGGSDKNPLAHTITSARLDYIKLNGEDLSEFLLHGYLAAYLGVPIVFLSGDQDICNEAKSVNENIVTVAVSEGRGGSSTSIHPNKSVELIRQGMEEALTKDFSKNILDLPEKFTMELSYKRHREAYKHSFYPGARLVSPKSVVFEADDYYEILRARAFLL